MTILDSDIIIYSALPQQYVLRDFILANVTYISAVSIGKKNYEVPKRK